MSPIAQAHASFEESRRSPGTSHQGGHLKRFGFKFGLFQEQGRSIPQGPLQLLPHFRAADIPVIRREDRIARGKGKNIGIAFFGIRKRVGFLESAHNLQPSFISGIKRGLQVKKPSHAPLEFEPVQSLFSRFTGESRPGVFLQEEPPRRRSQLEVGFLQNLQRLFITPETLGRIIVQTCHIESSGRNTGRQVRLFKGQIMLPAREKAQPRTDPFRMLPGEPLDSASHLHLR